MYSVLRLCALVMLVGMPTFAASISFGASMQVDAGVEDPETFELLEVIRICDESLSQSGVGTLDASTSCGTSPIASASAGGNDLQGGFSSYGEAFNQGDFITLSGHFQLAGYYNLRQRTGLQTVVVPQLHRGGSESVSCGFSINGSSVGCDGAVIQLQGGGKHLVHLGFSFSYEILSLHGASANGGYDLSSIFTPVPEPSTLAMIPAGLLALAIYRRRKPGS